MTETNESKLLRLSKETKDSPEYNAIRDDIFNSNLGLVGAVITRLRARNHTEFDDIQSVGQHALLDAINGFDLGRGFMFSTFAMKTIYNHILKHKIKDQRNFNRGTVEYTPTLITKAHVAEVKSSDASENAGELRRIFDDNVAELTDLERTIITLRFGFDGEEPKTLEDTGIQVMLTKERVRQIQNNALAKLREAMELCVL